MFLVVPSSRLRSWTWSSWMRTVFSTMPSLAPAILSVKNRSHSASLNLMLFRASSWVRRLAIELCLGRDREVLVRLRLQELDELPLERRLRLVGRGSRGIRDELGDDRALRADRRSGRTWRAGALAHAASSLKAKSRRGSTRTACDERSALQEDPPTGRSPGRRTCRELLQSGAVPQEVEAESSMQRSCQSQLQPSTRPFARRRCGYPRPRLEEPDKHSQHRRLHAGRVDECPDSLSHLR